MSLRVYLQIVSRSRNPAQNRGFGFFLGCIGLGFRVQGFRTLRAAEDSRMGVDIFAFNYILLTDSEYALQTHNLEALNATANSKRPIRF